MVRVNPDDATKVLNPIPVIESSQIFGARQVTTSLNSTTMGVSSTSPKVLYRLAGVTLDHVLNAAR
jgi:hypothetical protein